MRTRPVILGVGLCLAAALTVAGCSPPTKVVRLNLKKDDSWTYTYKVDTFVDPSKVDPNDKSMKEYAPGKGSAQIEGVVAMKVTDVKNGVFTIRKYTTFDLSLIHI